MLTNLPCPSQPIGGERRPAGARLVWAALLVIMSGCSQTSRHEQDRQQAQQHWDAVRADVKLQLAEKQLRGGHIDEALLTAQEAVRLNPRAVKAHVLVAQVLLEKDQAASADRILQEAAAIAPDHPEVNYMLGLTAERRGQLDEAIQHYHRAGQLDPTQIDYLVAEAECLVAADRVRDAFDLVIDRRKQVDDDGTLDVLRAEIARLLGNDADTLAALQTAVRTARDTPRLTLDYGLLLQRLGQSDQAIAVLRPIYDQAPDESSAALVRALASAYETIGRIEEAKRVLERRLQAHPDGPDDWLMLARIALKAGDWPTARRCAAEAQRLKPSDPDAYLLTGYAAWKQHDATAAEAALRSALAADPQDALAQSLLGLCLSNRDATPSLPPQTTK